MGNSWATSGRTQSRLLKVNIKGIIFKLIQLIGVFCLPNIIVRRGVDAELAISMIYLG